MSLTGTKRLIVIATAGYCLSLYPAVLHRTQATGYDAPIYWRAARGDLSLPPPDGRGHQVGWVYSDRLLPLIKPAGALPYPVFLAMIHIGNSLGIAALMAACLRRAHEYPTISGAAAFVVGAKASDIICSGNVAGLLCGMAVTPWGALAAAAVKPYFVLALVFHAAIRGPRASRGLAVPDRRG